MRPLNGGGEEAGGQGTRGWVCPGGLFWGFRPRASSWPLWVSSPRNRVTGEWGGLPRCPKTPAPVRGCFKVQDGRTFPCHLVAKRCSLSPLSWPKAKEGYETTLENRFQCFPLFTERGSGRVQGTRMRMGRPRGTSRERFPKEVLSGQRRPLGTGGSDTSYFERPGRDGVPTDRSPNRRAMRTRVCVALHLSIAESDGSSPWGAVSELPRDSRNPPGHRPSLRHTTPTRPPTGRATGELRRAPRKRVWGSGLQQTALPRLRSSETQHRGLPPLSRGRDTQALTGQRPRSAREH